MILLTFEQFKGCREGRRPEGLFGGGGDCSSSDSDSDDDGSKGGDACHGKGCDNDSPRHPIRPPHRFK